MSNKRGVFGCVGALFLRRSAKLYGIRERQARNPLPSIRQVNTCSKLFGASSVLVGVVYAVWLAQTADSSLTLLMSKVPP